MESASEVSDGRRAFVIVCDGEMDAAGGGEEGGVRLESDDAGDSDGDKESKDEDGDAERNESGLFG